MYAFGDEHQVAQYYHEYVKENLLHVIFCMDVTPSNHNGDVIITGM